MCLPPDASYQAGVTWFTASWESALQRTSLGGAVCGVHGWFRSSHISSSIAGAPILTLLDDPWERIFEYSWGSAALGYLYRRLCGVAQKNVKEIAEPLAILQVITIKFNSNPHLVYYILITFAIVSCGCGSIFLSANLTEALVVVKLLLRNNPH